jgi:hypothetical protein
LKHTKKKIRTHSVSEICERIQWMHRVTPGYKMDYLIFFLKECFPPHSL